MEGLLTVAGWFFPKQIPCQFCFYAWNQRLVEMPGELGGLDAPTRCVESAECPDVAHPDSGVPSGRIERIILIGVTVDTKIVNELARKLIDAMPGSAESLDTMRGDLEKNFRGLLELYNFRALYDRQAARQGELLLKGIEEVSWEAEEWFHRGTLIRGRRTTIEMREDNFSCEGEMLLLASVLA